MIQVRTDTPATDHEMERAQQAADLQLMNDRELIPGQSSAVSLVASTNMFPVIRALTDVVKHFMVQLQDHLSVNHTERQTRESGETPNAS